MKCKDIKERILNITETYYNKYINNNNSNINNTIAKKFDKDERTDDYIASLAAEALDLQAEFAENEPNKPGRDKECLDAVKASDELSKLALSK